MGRNVVTVAVRLIRCCGAASCRGAPVIPVGSRERQELLVVERRSAADWTEWSDGAVVFVPLVGEAGWPG